MNLSKIKVNSKRLEENQKAINQSSADLGRIQQAFEAAESRRVRINELRTQRNDVLADALIVSGNADVSSIDTELRRLELAENADSMSFDIAKSALSKMNQRLLDLEASRKSILVEIKRAISEAIETEISALSGEIDQCIATMNAAALRGEALARLSRTFGSANGLAKIERFSAMVRLPASVTDLHTPAEFTCSSPSNKTITQQYAALLADLEKAGAIQRAP